MKYLVLGSSGQIGMELTRYLRKKGKDVITFDISETPEQDLRVSLAAEEVIKNADFVFFLAFDVGGSRYLQKYQNTFEFINNNMKLMTNTFELLKKYEKPFIFASSQMSNMDYSTYGVLKSIGEFYTKTLNGLIAKFWNVYGVEHDLSKSHVITDFILSAKTGKIEMLTDGTEERQMLHAQDCCECLEILADKYNDISREDQLHVASFEWVRIIDIATIISKIYNNAEIVPSNKIDTVQKNKRNAPCEQILQYWTPKINLETGIRMVARELESSSLHS